MSKQLLIYDKVVPVSRESHRDIAVQRTSTLDFAKDINSVPIVDSEFSRVASEMPIVFAKTEKGAMPLALMGTAQDRNAFVTDEGLWSGRYIPAFLRRYPFVFAVDSESDRLTLCVDESFSGLNSENLGERLFDGAGTNTTYLDGVLKFMEDYQATFARTERLCERLLAHDLLEEARIEYTTPDGRQGGVTGFMRVSATKLAGLDDADIVDMFRSGDLALAQMHLQSLNLAEVLVGKAIELSAEVPDTSEDADAT